ncbi:MAG TPA: CrcB family protein [Acidimicrobiales bacterium]|nr:CrcB family protein [Acidimicrobiales bacterium]
MRISGLDMRAAALAQIAVGGMFGAAARDAIEQSLPTRTGTFPLATFMINLSGALLLGALLEGLVRAGDDSGRRRDLRLFAGTGFLGAFTTYSTFSIEADLLVHGGRVYVALFYAALTIIGGLSAVVAGIALGAGHRRWMLSRMPVDPDLDANAGGNR